MKFGLAVVVATVMACGGDSEPDYIIPSTTKCADAETKAALTAYNDVDGSLEFSHSTGMLDSLSVGDILNSGPADAAPHGMLRKVTSIDRSGGRVVLQTVEGTLGEAIQKGDFQLTKVLSAADFPPNPKMAALGPTITFDNGVRLDFDDVTTNLSTSGNPSIAGSLGLTGHVRFNPTFLVTGRIRNFHVENFEMSLEFEGDSDLALTAELAGSLGKETEIFSLTLTEITVPIGPFILLFSPQLHFNVGISGSVAVSLTFHEVGSYDGVTGTRYDDGSGWTSLNRGNSTGTIDAPSASFSAVLDAYVGVQADCLLYHTVSTGPYFYVKIGPSLDFETPRDPFLQAGLRIVAGLALHLYIFGHEFGTTTLAEYNELFPLLSSPNSPPSLLITSPAPSLYYLPTTPIHFQAAAYDLEDGAGVSINWSSDVDGDFGTGGDLTTTLHPASPGLRNITATATDSAGLARNVGFQLTIGSPGATPAIAEPRVNQSLWTYDSVLRGSATSPFFPGADLCTEGFTFDWASNVGADTIGPVRCSLGSARATITYVGNGPRVLTLGVTDPFGVRTTTTRNASVVDAPGQFFGATGFSSPPPNTTVATGGTVLVNATADPRKIPSDPLPFTITVPLTFTFTATSYAADGTTELATIDIGQKVETAKATAGTGVTPPLSWVPGSTPGFIDPTLASLSGGQKVALTVTVIDGAGHLGTDVMFLQVTP